MYRIIGADGREYGPVSADALRRWVAEGRLTGQSRVQAEGANEWKPLSAFPELADASPPPSAGTRNHPMTVAGFVLSLLGLSCCCGGPLFSLIGLVLSIIGLVETRKRPDQFDGQGLAVAGIVLGLVGLVLAAAGVLSGLVVNLLNQGRHWRPHRGWA